MALRASVRVCRVVERADRIPWGGERIPHRAGAWEGMGWQDRSSGVGIEFSSIDAGAET